MSESESPAKPAIDISNSLCQHLAEYLEKGPKSDSRAAFNALLGTSLFAARVIHGSTVDLEKAKEFFMGGLEAGIQDCLINEAREKAMTEAAKATLQ